MNNAGIGGQGLAIEDIDETTFDAMVAVNMKGSFFATQAVVPAMKERIDGMATEIPMGRIGTLDDISWAVAWLASKETDFLTGQVLSPNGGATIVGI